MGGRRGTPWTGCQSIAGQHRHTQDKQPHTHSFTPKGNVERPINLTVMFLDCGRNLEFPERSHACTGRTCKLHAERPRAGSRTQDLLAARQQCYQHVQYDLNHSVLEPGLPQKKGTFIPIYTTTETRTFSNHYTLEPVPFYQKMCTVLLTNSKLNKTFPFSPENAVM
ncbi:hypothetical protein XENORESO_002672 [Xenotaenia resolanae]|uniref:Uncharacterized protein n=1 Tax=Xenotaenia resolanae TaxID=208358 RepID=A0ABV0WVC7_9TELE